MGVIGMLGLKLSLIDQSPGHVQQLIDRICVENK